MTSNQSGKCRSPRPTLPTNHGHRARSGIVSEKSFLSYYKNKFLGRRGVEQKTGKRDERTGARVQGGGTRIEARSGSIGPGVHTPMNLSQALQSASLTDPGRVRDHNEDCIEARPELGLYVLADGMGGYNAGEVASGMATSLIADGLAEAWQAAH